MLDRVVGVDIKSHQTGTPVPLEAVVAGNVAQDTACDEVRRDARPQDVLIPSGGFFAFAVFSGRMVTGPISGMVRDSLRRQAEVGWRQRVVQGRIASLGGEVVGAALDVRAYTRCRILQRWRPLLLSTDQSRFVDLAAVLYRAIRAVGGSWTEALHSDAALLQIAAAWSEAIFHFRHFLSSLLENSKKSSTQRCGTLFICWRQPL